RASQAATRTAHPNAARCLRNRVLKAVGTGSKPPRVTKERARRLARTPSWPAKAKRVATPTSQESLRAAALTARHHVSAKPLANKRPSKVAKANRRSNKVEQPMEKDRPTRPVTVQPVPAADRRPPQAW